MLFTIITNKNSKTSHWRSCLVFLLENDWNDLFIIKLQIHLLLINLLINWLILMSDISKIDKMWLNTTIQSPSACKAYVSAFMTFDLLCFLYLFPPLFFFYLFLSALDRERKDWVCAHGQTPMPFVSMRSLGWNWTCINPITEPGCAHITHCYSLLPKQREIETERESFGFS